MSWASALDAVRELDRLGWLLAGLGGLAALASLACLVLVPLGKVRALPAGAALLALGWLPLVLADWQGAQAALGVAEEELDAAALYGFWLGLAELARAVAHAAALLPTLAGCLLLGLGLARLPRFQPPG